MPRTESNVRYALRRLRIVPTQDLILSRLTFTNCQAVAFNGDPILVEIRLRNHRSRITGFRDCHLDVALLTNRSLGIQPAANQNLCDGKGQHGQGARIERN